MEKNDTKPIVLKLKISEAEKYKNDCQWFKDYVDYIIPTKSFTIRDYAALKMNYDVVNNNLEGFRDELKTFCNPLGELAAFSVEEDIQPFNTLPNKINIFRGEILKRRDTHKVIILNSDRVREKNELLKSYINEHKVQPELEAIMESSKMQLEGASPEEVQQFMEQARQSILPDDFNIKDFKTEWQLFTEHIIKHAYFDQDIKDKKLETIEDVLITDRCFVYVGWKHGKPSIEVLNPLFTGFHKSPNEKYVHKGDYAYYRNSVTVLDILTEYGDRLSDKELHELTGVHSSATDKRHDVIGGTGKIIRDNFEEEYYREAFPGAAQGGSLNKAIGKFQTSSGSIRDKYANLVWKTHVEFKAFRKVVFLTYLNEYNKEVVDIVSDDFEIPEFATKVKFINKWHEESEKYEWVDPFTNVSYTAEELWIPRRYEATRLGSSIFVDCREVPNQPMYVNNPYSDFELSYKGMIFNNRNTESISLVRRALPFLFQAFFVKHLINRELSKYQGFTQDIDTDQIPEGLGQDHEGVKIRDHVATWAAIKKKTGYNFYSGTQTSLGALPPSTRSPGSNSSITGTAAEILNLQRLYDVINLEIGTVMGISPQREAQSVSQLTATDNQQNLQQSFTITEFYFNQHNEVWKYVLQEYIRLFKIYAKDLLNSKNESYLHYILPNGTEELIKITPEVLMAMDDLGIYLTDSGQDQMYRDIMLQMSHAVTQNAGQGATMISSLIKKITEGGSPEEIHKDLLKLEEKASQQQANLEKMRSEAEAKMQAKELEFREDAQAHEIDKIVIKGEIDKELKVLDMYKFQDDLNKDQDGIPDPLEALKVYHELEFKKKALNQKDRDMDLKEEKMHIDKELKEKQIRKKPTKS